MSLRQKTLLSVGVTILCVFMALSLILSSIWLNSFVVIETQQTRQNVERVRDAIANELIELNSTLNEWASWNETYAFIEDGNSAYIESHLNDMSLTNLRLNVMLFLHKSDRIIYGKGFDFQNKKAAPFASSLEKHLAIHSQLGQHTNPNSSLTGIILLPEGPLLVASQPILGNERQGDIRGTLIFGRYLNTAEKKRLEALTHLSITLEPFKEAQLPKGLQALSSSLSNPKEIFVHPLSPAQIAGYTHLPDIYGDPGLLLGIGTPRDIYLAGQNSCRYLIVSLLGVAAIVGVITLVLLEKFVLSRLVRLSVGVSRISSTGDLSMRFRESGRDELSRLTVAINQLLTTLQLSQQALYQANADLETRVEQRTAALTQANSRLEESHQELDELLRREQTALAVSEAARNEAETANRIKDEFLAVLSHELRTPLNPILGWSKLLRTRKLDENSTARALETIERNAQLQTQLIEDLLDVSRILQGKLNLKICAVNLVPTIESAIETVRLAAQAKSIEIKTVFEPDVGQVSGDPNRLQQVLWNLLSNAVKFTPTGGRVEIRLECLGKQAQISVLDTGKGIKPDFLPYVFDYFRQADSTTTRKFGGLGLGLAIVHHLVELHGGTVWAESRGEGLGATFTVTLPLMNVVPQTPQHNKLPNDSSNLEGVKVLVVDDEVDSLNLTVFILQQYGAQVKAVASAHSAIEILSTWQPDVLLSDIGMPDMDGYMLIRKIRSLPPEQGGEIQAIALTAYASEADREQALNAGFTTHITKPVEPANLVTVIAKAG